MRRRAERVRGDSRGEHDRATSPPSRARACSGQPRSPPGCCCAPLARAETGWVDDQVRLNLRTGPGSQYRILGSVETGDSVEILSRGDGWIEVSSRREVRAGCRTAS